MSEEIKIVEDFIAAFNASDVEKIMGFFGEDAVYHNMPMEPATGEEAIRKVIDMFVGPAEKVDWEVLNIAQTGSTVLTERMDRFVIGGKTVELPIMGAFDIEGGRIAAWRDYFDVATWQRQMGG